MTSEMWRYLLPEIVVVLTGAFILIADLIWIEPKPGAAVPSPEPDAAEADTTATAVRSRAWLAWIGIAGLVVAAGVLTANLGGRATMFQGIIVIDPLAVFFKYLFLGIGILVLLMSMEAVPRFSRWTAEFYALVVWCTLGNMLLASANELFTIFLCLQLTSLPLIVLIGFAKRDPKSGEASLKYLLLVLVSTAVLLYGMSLIYGSLGTSTLPEIGKRLAAGNTLTPVIALGLVLLLTGFAFKITAAPFHWWVPDAYEGAPNPVTAFMSVGSKFAGFALALRIIIEALRVPLDWSLIFGVMAAISMFIGNLGAIRQTNIKRMLAYSGIAQAGYLLVGVAALSGAGISAVLFYAIAYTLANLAAFGAVIVVANATGSVEIEDYAGLSRRSPLIALGAHHRAAFAGRPAADGGLHGEVLRVPLGGERGAAVARGHRRAEQRHLALLLPAGGLRDVRPRSRDARADAHRPPLGRRDVVLCRRRHRAGDRAGRSHASRGSCRSVAVRRIGRGGGLS